MRKVRDRELCMVETTECKADRKKPGERNRIALDRALGPFAGMWAPNCGGPTMVQRLDSGNEGRVLRGARGWSFSVFGVQRRRRNP
jgi:hypothetical protein